MSITNFNHNINEIKTLNNKSVRATLLVPKSYLKILDEHKIKNSSLEDLIRKFSIAIEKKIINVSPNFEKHTTQYQGLHKEKLNLTRCHLRCNPMVWHHWKRLSNHFGLSMCNLFIICLKKLTSKDLESVGTPTDSRLLHNFSFYEVTNFTRSYSHRWLYVRSYKKKSVKNEREM